jgi:putative heme-binding domain-containing protein
VTLTVLVTFSWLIGAVFAQGSRPDVKDPKLIAEGDAVFAKSCSIPYCHGKEGTAGRAPALNNRKWDIAQLHQVVLKGVPNSSMPNWDDKLSEREIWAAVAYVLSISADATPDKHASPPPAVQSGRTAQPAVSAGALPESLVGLPSRGEELFFAPGEKGCAGCHTIDGKGVAVGPDLTGYSRKSAMELYRDIVFPGAHVDPAQQLLRITMKDGEKIAGLKKEETAAAIRVFDLGGSPPVLRRLAKDQIHQIEVQAQSAMPSRYGEILTLRQLLDLVSFLKSSGAPSPARVTFLDLQ